MLQFGVLGPLTVDRTAERLPVPSGRARSLLGALIVHAGVALPVDTLTDLLWAGQPPRTAATVLHGHVSRLRQALGTTVVQTVPAGYVLAGPYEVDSGRFRALVGQASGLSDPVARSAVLRQALRLWRGPALAEFCYESFAQSEIAALEELRVAALEDAIEAELAAGGHALQLSELQSLVRQYPLRERLWGNLMVCLYRAGRQSEALDTYRQAHQLMATELGVEPGPALRDLHLAILRQDVQVVAPPRMRAPARTIPGKVGRAADRSGAGFAGREADLACLRTTLDAVDAHRQPAMITVIGEPGIGKSRLAQEFIAGAGERFTVFTIGCEPQTDTAYFPLYQLLVQAAAQVEAPQHLVGQLEASLSGRDPAADPMIGSTVTRLLSAFAMRRPVLLVLEDIHWAQPALLDLIASIPAGVRSAVMLLCLARPELAEIRPSFGHQAEVINLRHLAPDEILHLVLDALPETGPDIAAELASAAGGNPLFALQLIAWAADGTASARPVPAAVRTLLAYRISALGPGEQTVIRCAAVAGREFTIEGVQTLMPAHARPAVDSLCQTLTQHQLLQPTSHGYRFRHELIQRAAYLAIEPQTRARLHERYGQWLATVAPTDRAPSDETTGYHFEQAHDNLQTVGARDDHVRRVGAQAATHLRAAGRRAFHGADLRGASSLLTRALRVMPHDHKERVGLLIDAARPLRASGRITEAVAVLLEAADRAQELGDTATQWRARLELTLIRAFGPADGGPEHMLQTATRAIEPLTTVQDDEGLADAWIMIAFHREMAGQLSKAAAAYRHANRHALRTPASPRDATVAWGLATVLLEGPAPAQTAIAQCRKLLNHRGMVEPGVMFELAVLLAITAQFDHARELLDQAEVNVRERGAIRPPLFLALARARVELAAGNLESAEQHARQGLELGAAKGGDEADTAHAILLCRLLCRQHRFDAAEETLAAFAHRTFSQDIVRTAWWDAIRARIRVHRQAIPQANDLARKAATNIDGTDFLNHRADLHLTLAEIHHAAGQDSTARDAISTAVHLFKAKGSPTGLAAARALSEHAERSAST
ncbi:AfsR/SARP family transcriptional regulator [Catellatospora tritici]|uniref:AfsR/SARP family transcriptional regulator n=1 Tax=Catellatospora tritici TaxID=2851566 RepID=UPI0020C1C880|nr:AfsR/SARP family transcriptional regulator [Catellatospora tritici]